MNKWWIYQDERFPLKQYIPMVAAFSFCAVSYSAFLRGTVLAPAAFFTAFITALAFFMLLRVADEFKDFEDDSKYRSYRPVPRGLVTLGELRIVGVALVLIQGAAALIYQPALLPVLLVAWVYFGMMSKEFFAARWLRRHPLCYMVSHMFIMPLIDLYATACDWIAAGEGAHALMGLMWFLIASFFNGAVIEIGRKIRPVKDEEEGVETYSYLWGINRAVYAWFGAMLLAGAMALAAGAKIGFLPQVAMILGAAFAVAVFTAYKSLATRDAFKGKHFESVSGVWVLSMYIALGVLPILRIATGGF